MALSSGTRLGPYEVTSPIGAGGMGEVYRATDTRLKREVAIKVLPSSLAGDPERLARFQREAEVLASLNHPHIAAIYGLEEGGTVRALVMELVEGPTLADRIAAGAMPFDEALPIARQIADALEAAHEQGIIHRDLKPANIKVRPDGTVKVLDFGLAKAMEPAAGALPQVTQPPTITTPAMTQAGMILGTAAYMSPEQARGRPADRRADIWAFGAVLFEMLTGTRAFEDEDVSLTLSKVLRLDPDFDALPKTMPARVRQVLAVCLRKDPRQRASDIHDVRLALDGAFDTEGSQNTSDAGAPRPIWRRTLPVALAASLLTALIAGAVVWSLAPSEERAVSRFDFDLPGGQDLRNTGRPVIALSRDGRRFVYNTTQGLFVRAMDELVARVIPGTEPSLNNPFFSPDGESVGYWQAGQLKRIAVTGGVPAIIGAAESPFGVSWESGDTILFGLPKGIMRVPASGGTPELVVPAKAGEQMYGPQLLPGGEWVLFCVTTLGASGERWDGAQIVVHSLSSGQREVVLQRGCDARVLPTGHLIYALGTSLFAVPFDAGTRKVTGSAVPLEQGILRATGPSTSTGSANYDVSEAGVLVYATLAPDARRGTPTWVARDGRETPLTSLVLQDPRNPRLSPDGKRLALIVADDIWVHDVAGRPPIKLTSDGGRYSPLWTPDGLSLVYEGSGQASLSTQPADGSGTPRAASPAGHFHPGSFGAGDEFVGVRFGTTETDIVRWSFAKPDVVEAVVETPAREGAEGVMVSPDGRWLAYASNQTGQQEIWVRPYPGPGAALRISPNGGIEPVWARNGRELYYLEGTKLMAVAVEAAQTFNFSPAAPLFDNSYLMGSQPPSYDVAPDGRFLMIKPVGDTKVAPPQVVVISNWFEELKRRVPVN